MTEEQKQKLTEQQVAALNDPNNNWETLLKGGIAAALTGLDPEQLDEDGISDKDIAAALTPPDPDKPIPPVHPVTKSA